MQEYRRATAAWCILRYENKNSALCLHSYAIGPKLQIQLVSRRENSRDLKEFHRNSGELPLQR